VAILKALFWTIWRSAVLVFDRLGNQIGEAYVMSDLMRDLKVISWVSFWWPQLVPESAFITLRRSFALPTTEET
jgi:hypothetical protein